MTGHEPTIEGGAVPVPASILPEPGEWNPAVAHSLAYPTHVLGPYEDAGGVMHMCCDGDGDPNEPSNCDFDTGPKT